MRKLRIEWGEFERAIDSGSVEASGYVDLDTGAAFYIMNETAEQLRRLLGKAPPDAPIDAVLAAADAPDWQKQDLRRAWNIEVDRGEHLLRLDPFEFRDDHRDLADFTATVADHKLRRELEQAIDGPGAFRRFSNVLHQTFRERDQWFTFLEQRRREKATAWLAARDIEVEWVMPPPLPPRPEPREHLLCGVLKFTRAVAKLRGVKRISLLGSLAREEPEPKDADVLVIVADDVDLAPLAKLGRKLAGHAQQLNRGADVFLGDEQHRYIGRTCHWRDCGPGFRSTCDALHCGHRQYLHDDFRSVRLNPKLVAEPPIDLWPSLHARVAVPPDVECLLLTPLRAPVT